MQMTRSFFRTLTLPLLAAGAVLLSFPALAQRAQHAHVHGKVELGIAVDGPSITIEMESPLDNLLGFERAPRTDVEKNAVEQMVARLRAADHLFQIDPAAGCKLGPVQLESAALGLGKAEPDKDGHAELEATFAFNCTNAAKARFVDTQLFEAFPATRQIEAEIAAPDGQFKRSLKRPASGSARIGWGK